MGRTERRVDGRHIADHGRVVDAVVGPLKFGDMTAAGKSACSAQRVEHRLRARTAEAHPLHGWQTRAQQLGQLDFQLGGRKESRAVLDVFGQRARNSRMGVTEDQRRGVVDKIEAPIAVDVGGIRTAAAAHVEGERIDVDAGARIAAGQ